jgi:putative glutamine amidotransferase
VRPRIGITSGTGGMPISGGVLASYYVGTGYARSVVIAGGLPMILPAVEGSEEEDASEFVRALDGVLLAGGTDIHPETYGQTMDAARTQKPDIVRDRFEMALVREARDRGLPILGICRGFQMLNVAYGGTLDQHRPHEGAPLVDDPDLRMQVTDLSVDPTSKVGSALGVSHMQVYCLHHQAIDRLGDGLRVTSTATDELVEGIEDPSAAFVAGVLWHPEQMTGSTDAQRVYASFVRAAADVAAAVP